MSDLRWIRTANAGGLLELDGRRLLLDGICGALDPYLPTPPAILDWLTGQPVDLAAFTHGHPDHFREAGVHRGLAVWGDIPVLGTRDIAEALSPRPVTAGAGASVGPVAVTPIPSRHIGAAYRSTEHRSLLVEGSRRCLFLGDAAPARWEARCRQPDILFAPFVYAATDAGWRIVEHLSPGRLVLLHLPARGNDPEGLWPAVEGVLSRHRDIPVDIPEMGETLTIE